MTALLQEAFDRASQLPEELQNQLARDLLDEIEWDLKGDNTRMLKYHGCPVSQNNIFFRTFPCPACRRETWIYPPLEDPTIGAPLNACPVKCGAHFTGAKPI